MKPVNLREMARGQPCMVRSHYCSFDPETTVLAHLRAYGSAGMGMKPPDTIGVWACHECHALLDGRIWDEAFPADERMRLAMEALMRTLSALDAMGVKMCST